MKALTEFFQTKVNKKYDVLSWIVLSFLAIGVIGFLCNTAVLVANEGSMPMKNLLHGNYIISFETREVIATEDVKLLFLSGNIIMNNLWMNNPIIPDSVRSFGEIIGYPPGLYMASIGDYMLIISKAGVILLLPILLIIGLIDAPIQVYLRG